MLPLSFRKVLVRNIPTLRPLSEICQAASMHLPHTQSGSAEQRINWEEQYRLCPSQAERQAVLGQYYRSEEGKAASNAVADRMAANAVDASRWLRMRCTFTASLAHWSALSYLLSIHQRAADYILIDDVRGAATQIELQHAFGNTTVTDDDDDGPAFNELCPFRLSRALQFGLELRSPAGGFTGNFKQLFAYLEEQREDVVAPRCLLSRPIWQCQDAAWIS